MFLDFMNAIDFIQRDAFLKISDKPSKEYAEILVPEPLQLMERQFQHCIWCYLKDTLPYCYLRLDAKSLKKP